MKREIKQVFFEHGFVHDGIYITPVTLVLCNDGSLWTHHAGTWVSFPPIPQDEEASQKVFCIDCRYDGYYEPGGRECENPEGEYQVSTMQRACKGFKRLAE